METSARPQHPLITIATLTLVTIVLLGLTLMAFNLGGKAYDEAKGQNSAICVEFQAVKLNNALENQPECGMRVFPH